MIVKSQRPIKLVNTCSALYDDELVIKGILEFTDRPVARNKKVFMFGNYPAVAVYHHKLHIHRVVWFAVNGGIPHDMHVHHINGDKLDARIENLTLMSKSDHPSHHNKGKTLTDEHRARISEANTRRTGMKMKKRVNIEPQELYSLLNEGCTLNAIAKHFGCDWSTIQARIYENPELLK